MDLPFDNLRAEIKNQIFVSINKRNNDNKMELKSESESAKLNTWKF
jgi:hypothetical protein